MSDLTDEMIDAAWDAYSDEVAESGVPSTQVKVAIAAALRVLAEHLSPANNRTLRPFSAIDAATLADAIAVLRWE